MAVHPTPGRLVQTALLTLATVSFGAACSDTDFISLAYDDLNGLTRARIGPITGDSPESFEVVFLCAGEGLCRPDSVSLTLSTVGDGFCPRQSRVWSTSDSVSFSCDLDSASIDLGSDGLIVVRSPLAYGGWAGPARSATFESVGLTLALEDVGRLGSADDATLRLASADSPLPLGTQFYLSALMSRVEDAPSRPAPPPLVYASYDSSIDSTAFEAMLPPVESPEPFAIEYFAGRCSGRGWCGEPFLQLHMHVPPESGSLDPTRVWLHLDSLRLQAPDVIVRAYGDVRRVAVRLGASDLAELARAATIAVEVDAEIVEFSEAQQSVVRELWNRIDAN